MPRVDRTVEIVDESGNPVGASHGPLTDGSGTIAAGGSSQQVFAANAARKYLLIVNQAGETLWVNFNAAAAADDASIPLLANNAGALEFGEGGGFVPTEAVNIVGASTGSRFTAKQG